MDTAIEETTMSFPTGWFQVAWSGELVPGAVLPLRYFSRELVCFRDGQGRARVLDAHCLQCGSHLGYGGTTCEQGIVCPLDGWVWDGAGVNTRIPGRTDVFTDDQVTAWATQEVNGCVVVWFDSAGRAPFWEPPVMPEATDPAFYPMYPHGAHRDVVRFPPQFFVENAADMPHLRYLHRWADIPALDWQTSEGHVFHNHLTGVIKSPKGDVTVKVENVAYGLGLVFNRLYGLHQTFQLIATTPVDERTSVMAMSFWVARGADTAGDVPKGLAKAVIDAQVAEVLGDRADRPVWENQVYVRKAPLVREERALAELRSWTRTQYPEVAAVAG